MTSTLPPIVQAFSGALGSAASNASAYPLDLVCTRLQTSNSRKRQGAGEAMETLRRIIKKRGISGLYDGLGTDTAATLISNFFYYYTYSFLRKRILKPSPNSSKASTFDSLVALEEIAIGFLAGVASRAISTPLSLITVRLQSERQFASDDEKGGALSEDEEEDSSGSIGSVIRHIYEESGLRGFWRGFETTTLLCLNPSMTLFLFQAFRRLILRGKDRDQPSPRQAFLGGAISNVIAVTILYPLILAKTRLQASRKQGVSSKRQPKTMIDVWDAAYRRDGPAGLYQGLEAQLIKGFLNQGLSMMIKQRLEQIVITVYMYRLRKNAKTVL